MERGTRVRFLTSDSEVVSGYIFRDEAENDGSYILTDIFCPDSFSLSRAKLRSVEKEKVLLDFEKEDPPTIRDLNLWWKSLNNP